MESRESCQKGGDGNGSGPSQESRGIVHRRFWQPSDFIGRLRHLGPPPHPSPGTSMKRLLLSLVALTAIAAAVSQAQTAKWVAGKHYTLVPTQRTQVPAGKIEVLEVFSYGCPACNTFRPVMKRLQSSLPKNAQIAYLPASWNSAENWPVFQRAYITAQQLGVADKAQEGMYDAI